MPDSDLSSSLERGLILGELASEIRSKNAGPFWITLDVFFASEPDYLFAVNSGALSGQAIASLYQVDPVTVKYFEVPAILAVKISFPRPVTAGSFEDRDLHAGQQHVLLAGLRLAGNDPHVLVVAECAQEGTRRWPVRRSRAPCKLISRSPSPRFCAMVPPCSAIARA